jgi:hypothetical protein
MHMSAQQQPHVGNGNGHPKSLGELIAAKRKELEDLELLNNAEFEITGTLDRVKGQVNAVLQGHPYDGKVLDIVRRLHVDTPAADMPVPASTAARTNATPGRTLGDLLEEHLKAMKINLSAGDLCKHAMDSGWKSKSSSPIGVVQQCLKTDARFKSHPTGEGNRVVYGLSGKHKGAAKKHKKKHAAANA